MDDDGLNMRNWGYYEPSHKGPLGLQLMPSVVDRDTRTFFSGRENPSMTDSTKEEIANVEDPSVGKDSCPSKKRPGAAASPPKAKKPKKGPSAPKKNDNPPAQRAKPAKKSIEVVISGIDMDISSIPTPVCTCTGTPQQCYRWGCGGWQSACCTTTISMYPLPMNNKRRGARIAGRKMSQGAFKKVLEKLASEGYNFSDPIDLRTYWAKHGTNKFVTIR
nr:protein BASIC PENTACYSTEINE2-like [Ipomoea batatas]